MRKVLPHTAARGPFTLHLPETAGPCPRTVTVRDAGAFHTAITGQRLDLWIEFTTPDPYFGPLRAALHVDDTGPVATLRLCDSGPNAPVHVDATNDLLRRTLADALTDPDAVTHLASTVTTMVPAGTSRFDQARRKDAAQFTAFTRLVTDRAPRTAVAAVTSALRNGYAGELDDLITAALAAVDGTEPAA